MQDRDENLVGIWIDAMDGNTYIYREDGILETPNTNRNEYWYTYGDTLKILNSPSFFFGSAEFTMNYKIEDDELCIKIEGDDNYILYAIRDSN